MIYIYPLWVYNNRRGEKMEHTKRSQANKEAILTRLNRISGQIEGLKIW